MADQETPVVISEQPQQENVAVAEQQQPQQENVAVAEQQQPQQENVAVAEQQPEEQVAVVEEVAPVADQEQQQQADADADAQEPEYQRAAAPDQVQEQQIAEEERKEEKNLSSDSVEGRVTRAFTVFDARQRGWLPQSNAKRLLETTLFAHHPNRDAVVDQLIKELLINAEIPTIEVGNKEPRIKQDDFVRVVSQKYPEPKSAEEVAASFSALKIDFGTNKLSRDNFVSAAVKANPSYTKERATVSWSRLFGENSSSVEFQPYRSVVNSVIHSTKIEGKS